MKVLEDTPFEILRDFLLQDGDENFAAVAAATANILSGIDEADADTLRTRVTEGVRALGLDLTAPIETECQRALLLSEGKGPTSLRAVVEQRLTNEECEKVFSQQGDLARSLWLHVNHRRVFDDAVSFRNARAWRDGKLYSAFEIELDQADAFSADDVPNDELLSMIQLRLRLSKKCGISVIDLPEADSYPPSVLAIIRHPSKVSSVAEHPEDGGRRLRYYLPQEEVILIYTPVLQRIEVCGDSAPARAIVSESFAKVALKHDVALKPLTWASYDTSRFFHSLHLCVPTVPGFLIEKAALIEIEMRLERWGRRLRLSVPFEDDIGTFAETYIGQSRVLRRALGIARVVLAVKFRREGAREPEMLDITISDRNRCSLSSNRSPEIRNFGRKLLAEWGILHIFRDLEQNEVQSFLPVLSEIYEHGSKEVSASFFEEREIDPKRLVKAGLIVRKGVDQSLTEYDDSDADRIPIESLAIFSVREDRLEQRVVGSLRDAVSNAAVRKLSPHLFSIGTMTIDQREVPCYLARGLGDQRRFVDAEMRLRALSAAGPGVVFAGKDPGWQFIGVNMIFPITPQATADTDDMMPISRTAVENAYRSSLGLILGGTTLTLVENEDGGAGTLHVPGKAVLPLFSEQQVRFFRLLVDAKKKGLPGVRTGELIEGSRSTGLQQMLGKKRWPVFQYYLEDLGHGWWALKTN